MCVTRLILVRHGETTWNLEGRYQGHLDSPLTPAGRAQAESLAVRLARAPFDALYSSDLGRARQTADAIARATGRVVQFDARLRERSLGIFQELRQEEAKQKFPDEYRRFKSGALDDALPGGESPRQHCERVVGCLSDLAQKHAGHRVVVVTHGGTLSAFLRHVLGLPLAAPRRFSRRNGSWNVFAFEDGKWLLETWGDVSHWAERGEGERE